LTNLPNSSMAPDLESTNVAENNIDSLRRPIVKYLR
jgi:hypothetical protein